MTPPIEVEGATTPPIMSSSPGVDIMDMSPLPHKAPHFVSQVTLPSPTPEPTPELVDEILPDFLSPEEPLTVQPSPVEAPTSIELPE